LDSQNPVLSATSAQLLVRNIQGVQDKRVLIPDEQQSALHNLSRDCKSEGNKHTITGLATEEQFTFSVFLRQG
jgi:hypothetical protein